MERAGGSAPGGQIEQPDVERDPDIKVLSFPSSIVDRKRHQEVSMKAGLRLTSRSSCPRLVTIRGRGEARVAHRLQIQSGKIPARHGHAASSVLPASHHDAVRECGRTPAEHPLWARPQADRCMKVWPIGPTKVAEEDAVPIVSS